eukprot:CAMPEP_0170926532 /NCGR_PEP_ID=MMETSP0735-20130129/12944_1 /TAXON_ID=186038 /ORGANISM="Fragilariopsis kerguelensis, Strain L26-C5" /LENGTH=299 /DNA_ID=CAMNT_0011326839 /DNA_START=32 /DNA_END=931 /DNA_ORIENTATION=-
MEGDDDIIEIDVGGTIIRALRSTLTQVPDTMFTSMFSGRWKGSLKRNVDGRIFLDHDPELIEIIVNFLRTKKIENHSMPVPSPEIPDKKKNQFNTLLHYFGLTDFFYPPSIFVPLDINNIEVVQLRSAVNVTKSENKIQFSKEYNEYNDGRFNFLACKPPLDSSGEGSFWKVTIDAVSNYGDGLLLGIIGQLDDSSAADSTCCAWTGGTSPYGRNAVFINGKNKMGHGGWSSEGFMQGECLYFHLKSNKLTMFSVKKNQKFTMDVGTTVDAYYIHFNMYDSGAKITLEPLNEEESVRLL